MGSGSYSDSAWSGYKKAHIDSKATREIFSKSSVPELLPTNFKFRESRDIAGEHPQSTPIIFALDVTGSMCPVLDYFARTGLSVLCKEVFERKAVPDPQVCVVAVGDFCCDEVPFQATQFESAIEPLAKQMQEIFFEEGGGGNQFEGYSGAHYFAARRTASDSIEKRGKKGYLFTIGDEYPTKSLTVEQIKEFFGDDVQADMSPKDLVDMASQYYNIFHLVIAQGSAFNRATVPNWKGVLGQRVILVDDVTKIAEIVVSAIQVSEGETLDSVAKSWDGDTGLTVRKAISEIPVKLSGVSESKELIRL